MGREVDRRDFHVNRTTPARAAELRSLASDVSAHLPGAHRITIEGVDPTTGNPARVLSESAPAERGHYLQRALEHVRTISPALGLEATQAPEFVADLHPQETSSGAVAVHLQQQYKGIAIFQAAQAVRFAPNGTLQETTGSSVTVSQDVPVAPQLSVQEAVRRAAEYVAVPQPDEQGTADPFGERLPLPRVDLTGFAPQVMAAFVNQPEQSTVLAPGPFEDTLKANLIWFPLGDQLQLGWEVLITMPNYEGQYRTIVDANSGEILYCRQLVRSVVAQGHVYHVDGGQARQMTPFPRPLTDYGLPMASTLPESFPEHWVLDNSASGNGVHARLGHSGPTVQGSLQDGVLTFNPADPVGNDQKVLNIFYYNSYMHDFFYLLGFQELDGNFQQDNFGRGGVASDRVDARAHSGAVFGTANMATPVDGFRPIMNMGLVTSTDRHTAFNHSTVVGAWVVNRAGGIRGFPYDSDFPDHFGQLGTGRYTEVHNIGEIWCATLMEMNRRIGMPLSLQLVVDALKLSPSNPSFLDMRNAILAALVQKLASGQLSATEHSTAHSGIWAVFARFGMGPEARSNGASLSAIVADFSTPTETPPVG